MRNGGPKIWLTQRGRSPYWTIRYVDPETGQVLQKSTGTTKKKDAERILGEFRSDLKNRRCVGMNTTSWEAFREKYETEVLSGLAHQTLRKTDTVFDMVERVLNPTRLADLTASRISKLVAELRDGQRSESTIAGYLAHLRAALSWAVSMGMLPAVPKSRSRGGRKSTRSQRGGHRQRKSSGESSKRSRKWLRYRRSHRGNTSSKVSGGPD